MRTVALCVAATLVALPALPAGPLFAAHEPPHGAWTAGPTTPPPGAERVTFKSPNPRLKEPVPAVLIRPKGPGPAPAVVLVHPCGGINQTMYDDWASWFVARGYIVLVPDSLAPWHQTSVCGNYTPLLTPHTVAHPTLQDAALDAAGALQFLRSRPDVIPTQTVLIGWSFGGSIAIIVTSTRFAERFARARYGGFQAAIAVYPGCGPFKNGTPARGATTPLLLLLGGSDDEAVPDECVKGGLALQSAGDPVEIHVYPGVTHSFDVPRPSSTETMPNGTVVHTSYNAAATADAHTRVAKFLDEHLR